jgi:adenine-specific DNA methylase
VENTVGRLIEGKTPKQVSNLKIADPACGSGSFLIGAYEYLLEWHLKWYVDNDPKKHPKAIFEYEYPTEEGTATEWRLRIGEKKSILTNNIYGVDIDDQAVEVTKLSLLLKVLEGETSDSMESQLSLLDERVLPYLGKNIQSGNSLIGHDFYETGQLGLLDEEEERRINTFSWESAFPEVFSRKKPGFDTVIGNPPYVLLQDEFRDDNQLAYFRSKFSVASYKIDTYHLFVERSVDLARSSGRCAMITPANFIANNYLASLRRFLLEESVIDHVMVIDGGVFDGISVDNAIFVLEASEQPTESFDLVHAYPDASRLHKKSQITISGSQSLQRQHVLFTGTSEKVTNALWDRILSQSCNLGSIANVNFGKQLRNRKQFTEDVIAVSRIEDIAEPYRPCYTGRDVSRYSLSWNGLACLNDEVARSGGCWDEDKQNAKNKILTRQIGEYPSFGIDRSGYQCLNTMFMIGVRDTDVDPAFVLGVLNSKVTKVYWLDRFYDQRRTFPKIKGTYLKELPIRTIDFSDTEDSARHEKMVIPSPHI